MDCRVHVFRSPEADQKLQRSRILMRGKSILKKKTGPRNNTRNAKAKTIKCRVRLVQFDELNLSSTESKEPEVKESVVERRRRKRKENLALIKPKGAMAENKQHTMPVYQEGRVPRDARPPYVLKKNNFSLVKDRQEVREKQIQKRRWKRVPDDWIHKPPTPTISFSPTRSAFFTPRYSGVLDQYLKYACSPEEFLERYNSSGGTQIATDDDSVRVFVTAPHWRICSGQGWAIHAQQTNYGEDPWTDSWAIHSLFGEEACIIVIPDEAPELPNFAADLYMWIHLEHVASRFDVDVCDVLMVFYHGHPAYKPEKLQRHGMWLHIPFEVSTFFSVEEMWALRSRRIVPEELVVGVLLHMLFRASTRTRTISDRNLVYLRSIMSPVTGELTSPLPRVYGEAELLQKWYAAGELPADQAARVKRLSLFRYRPITAKAKKEKPKITRVERNAQVLPFPN